MKYHYRLFLILITGPLFGCSSNHKYVQTFVHINMARAGETMNKLNKFQEFRKALKESEPVNLPKSTTLEFVDVEFVL